MAIELKEKYAHQLQRSNNLSINTLEGWNDSVRVAYSKNLIDQGIEPTEENLQKYQEEIEAQANELQKKYPSEPIKEIEAQVEEDQEIMNVWFPEGLPDQDDNDGVLTAWAGVSLRIALLAPDLIKSGREMTPLGIDRIQRTMKFLGIGWEELEQGANLAVFESVKYLRNIIPNIPDKAVK